MSWRPIAVALVVALAEGGCGKSSSPPVAPQPGGDVVAVVSGTPIRVSEVRSLMLRRGADARGGFEDRKSREMLLEDLVRREVLADAAVRAGFDQDPDFRAMWRAALAEKFWEAEATRLADTVEVSDEDVAAYYEQHANEFRSPERRRASVVTFRFPYRNSDEDRKIVREQAAKLREQALLADADGFTRLAQEHSQDLDTRKLGGDLGWLIAGASSFKIEPPVVQSLFAIPAVGGVAPLVETERAIYVVRLSDLRPPGERPLDEVRGAIAQRLRAERQEQALDRRYAELREDVDVRIDGDALMAVKIDREAVAAGAKPPSFPVGDR